MTAPFRKTSRSSLLCGLIAMLIVFTLAANVAAFADVSGAIYTTNSDGTTVNGNIYPSKDAVYLSGGPQNQNAAGLSPDGVYYFQVTDPSGAVLLSTDDYTCRQVQVTNGRVVGVPTASPPVTCTTGFHANGTANDANGALPVQLIPYNDTPNNGGVYKAWMTPVADYGELCAPNHAQHGFCDKDSKTDNFKIRTPGSTTAFVTVCKFNDQNDDGIQQATEPLIPHWPITATGVDGDTGTGVTDQTDDNGCVSFSFSGFTSIIQSETITLTEGTQGPDWTQTAPANGACTLTGTANVNDTCNVSNGAITLSLSPSDDATAPNFGNFNPNCTTGCTGNQVIVTKDANPIVTYTWTITKKVDKTEIDTAPGGATTFKYTVDVSHDTGTATMTGTIRVSNATDADITNVTVSDAVSDAVTDGGVCSVEAGAFHDGTGTVPQGDHVDVHYSCTFTQVPATGSNTNTATATWNSTNASGTANFDFSAATIVDGSVTVTDPLSGITPLGTASYTDTNPIEFTYSNTVTGISGTCVTQSNTATFTTNTTATTGSDSKSVKVCEGADLTVSKTATPTFTRTYNWGITKSATPTLIEQLGGGTASVSYKVVVSETGFNDSLWALAGTITVTNPNDWEAIATTVTEIAGCSVTNGNGVSIPKSGSVTLSYSCTTFASGASGTNTATATWTATTFSTPDGTATGTAAFAFTTPTSLVNQTITPTDTFNGGTAQTLCSLTSTPTSYCTLTAADTTPYTTHTYTYSRTITVPTSGCKTYPNTAATGTGAIASASVEACGPAKTGALTMGFWQNKNGQAIITGASQTTLASFLTSYKPFTDYPQKTGQTIASYVSSVIAAAQCSTDSLSGLFVNGVRVTATCNYMLKAQMLATALDVYFSATGNNKIGAPAPIGGVVIDLTKICNMIDGSGGTASCSNSFVIASSVFGGATSLSVSAILAYENTGTPSTNSLIPGVNTGTNAGLIWWYGQNKSSQVLAKNVFDAINNQVAFAP